MKLGVNAPISIMVAEALTAAKLETVQERTDAAMTLSFLCGFMYIIMLLLRLDMICNLIPDPMLSGQIAH